MKKYTWAENAMKLQRAIALGGDEDAVKANYIRMGGLIVLEGIKEPVGVKFEVTEPVTATEEVKLEEVTSTEDIVVKPKRAYKKKS